MGHWDSGSDREQRFGGLGQRNFLLLQEGRLYIGLEDRTWLKGRRELMGDVIITVMVICILILYGGIQTSPSAFPDRTVQTVEADDRGPRGTFNTVSD